MYIRGFTIINIRSIEAFIVEFPKDRLPGWHVILGANGSGKTSVVRSLALALAGPKEAAALRQNWGTWQRTGRERSQISVEIEPGEKDVFTGTGRRQKLIEVQLEFKPIETSIGGPLTELAVAAGASAANRSIWGTNAGWFSASYGPFRRFTGGDQAFDRLFLSNPRLASHLSAFGEDVALTEGLRWLRDLRVKQLEDGHLDGLLLKYLVEFLNNSGLLPYGVRVLEVRSEDVVLADADGARVAVEQMSDGYRSILSMIFDILRQMTKSYGIHEVLNSLRYGAVAVDLPGVVIVDEIDAHLHPSWQKDIGPWFTRCFPQVQFIVTTHSPIICRNADTVWRLGEPGASEVSGRIEGAALNRLIHGSILDAYGTEFFGRDVARSTDSKELLHELAGLNRRALREGLSKTDHVRMVELRAMLPTSAAET